MGCTNTSVFGDYSFFIYYDVVHVYIISLFETLKQYDSIFLGNNVPFTISI